jgi:hypothetical protein
MLNIFFKYNVIKLEINKKKNVQNCTNSWKSENLHSNDKWIKEEIKKKINRFLYINENGNTNILRTMGHNKNRIIKIIPINHGLKK